MVRDTLVVAGEEWVQASRTRLLRVLTLGYAGALAGANHLFILGLRAAEGEAAAAMGVATTEKPGALTAKVLESSELRQFLGDIVGEGMLDHLLAAPVLALWSGVVSMVLLPCFFLLGTSVSVAQEVESRSIRFLALRTERLPIVLGKFLGQLGMTALAGLVGVGVTLGFGLFAMVQVPLVPLVLASLEYTARALCFALPFGAVGLAVSQLVGRANPARGLAVFALLLMSVADGWLAYQSGPTWPGRLADLGRLFLPWSGWASMWSVDASALGLSALRALALSLVWVAVGYARFDRRDL